MFLNGFVNYYNIIKTPQWKPEKTENNADLQKILEIFESSNLMLSLVFN